MSIEDPYDDSARERIVAEPPKRVEAPVRLAFERDRARVVHAAASRRLAAKTQVVGPQTDDFVRNRLTHSLEVAQVARDLARAIGTHPDIAPNFDLVRRTPLATARTRPWRLVRTVMIRSASPSFCTRSTTPSSR